MRKFMETWVGITCWGGVIVPVWWEVHEKCCTCPGRNSLYSDYDNERKTNIEYVPKVSEVTAPPHTPNQIPNPKPQRLPPIQSFAKSGRNALPGMAIRKVKEAYVLLPGSLALIFFSFFLITASSMHNASSLHTLTSSLSLFRSVE